MDSERFQRVLDYFKESEIELPIDVRNAIEDVFTENDDIEEVECYTINDLEEFQQDLSLNNDVHMSMNGSTRGQTCNVWTYYGGVEYVLTEKIVLEDDNGELLETISDLEPSEDMPYSSVINPSSYQVVLVEKVVWDSTKKEFARHLHLYIYYPEGEPDVGEDDKYQAIYNQIMGGEEYGR